MADSLRTRSLKQCQHLVAVWQIMTSRKFPIQPIGRNRDPGGKGTRTRGFDHHPGPATAVGLRSLAKSHLETLDEECNRIAGGNGHIAGLRGLFGLADIAESRDNW